jgi:adenylylsulfate kinase
MVNENTTPGWVVWFVGLPGAGKSTYARAVFKALQKKKVDVRYLSMDERRKTYITVPEYTETERINAYRLFVEEAARTAYLGKNVIMDGTAHRLSMREQMRQLVPRFAEVFVRCSLETAMRRERNRPEGMVMAGLYEKALNRKETGTQIEGLGEVVGVDTEFEENPSAECIIDSDRESIEQGRDKVLAFLARWI